MNFNGIQFLLAFVLLPLLDAPWLFLQSTLSSPMFMKIQGGRALDMRLWPALVVYAALAYLLIQQKSITGAALAGTATYAVYDFTNLVVFKDYTLQFALSDSIWGGVLFAAAFAALKAITKLL
jgi:uncharacterized membrane protein